MNDLNKYINYDHLIAGVAGGIVSTLILHPFDLLKIRFAVNDGSGNMPRYNGVFNAFKHIVLYDGGFRGLYRGVIPNVIGSGASWGLYFFLYNIIKAFLNQNKENKLFLGPLEASGTAALSGIITLIITNPIWVVKTRLCLQNDDPIMNNGKKCAIVKYKGTYDALKSIHKLEGVRGLYKGLVPGLFGVSHGALQFMAYEELKNEYITYMNMAPNIKLNAVEYIGLAALSKIFAVNITYPLQVIRARLQDRNKHYKGFKDAIYQTWKKEGTRGFYKGLWPHLLRVTPATCITFVVYENIVQYLKTPVEIMPPPPVNSLVREE